MIAAMKGSSSPRRALVRGILIAVGSVSLALGAIGLVVPLLPTTPFLLLAAACFARASDRLHAWILRNRYFGPAIERWQTSRSLSPRAKWTAIPLVILTIGGSAVLLVEELALRGVLMATGLLVTLFLYRLPTRA
jgi:uncharacterized membrane protein YbaN (DUF454 family)